MLTQRMQIQAIADALMGLPVQINERNLVDPWRTCWIAVRNASSNERNAELVKALAGYPNRDMILETIMSAKAGYTPTYPSLQEIAKDLPPISWVWRNWVPRGMLTVFGAAQGSGKSFVMLDLSYRIIHNLTYPDGTPVAKPDATVVYVDAEMVPQILAERAGHYGLDTSRLFLMMPDDNEMIDFAAQRYQDKLIELVASARPEVIVIDSLSSIHSRGQNNVEDVRELLGFLTRIASSFQCGLILIHHIRKPGGGQQGMLQFDLSMEDLSGSGHITAMARVVWGLHIVQTGPEFDPNGPRELKMLKTNLGAYQDPMGFEFAKLHPAGVYLKWLEEAPKQYNTPTKADRCSEWLVNYLRDGAKPVEEVVEAAEKQEGYSRATVYRAREILGSRISSTEGRKSPGNEWELTESKAENQ